MQIEEHLDEHNAKNQNRWFDMWMTFLSLGNIASGNRGQPKKPIVQ